MTFLRAEPVLFKSKLDTQLGPMIAIADEQVLYLLEFSDRKNLEPEIQRLSQKTKSTIIPGDSQPIQSIKKELTRYFDGQLTTFKTPHRLLGTPFQLRVWEALKTIPLGETRSYADLAKAMGQPSAFRAVARANSTNQLVIVVPCHRVINTGGGLGGYSSGLMRKKWLIDHENSIE